MGRYFATTPVLWFLSATLVRQIDAESLGISLPHNNLVKYGVVQGRQESESQELEFYCWMTGSICAFADSLNNACSGFSDETDQTPYYQCICGNGAVSTGQACWWCLLAFNLTSDDTLYPTFASGETSGCSSAHVTIAPVPSEILASMSAWNSSYAAVLANATDSGGGASSGSISAGQGGSVTRSASLTTNAASQFTAAANSSAWTSTYTLVGGALPTTPNTGEPTSSATTTTKAGSGTGGAQGWNTGIAVIFSMIACGISVLYLL